MHGHYVSLQIYNYLYYTVVNMGKPYGTGTPKERGSKICTEKNCKNRCWIDLCPNFIHFNGGSIDNSLAAFCRILTADIEH